MTENTKPVMISSTYLRQKSCQSFGKRRGWFQFVVLQHFSHDVVLGWDFLTTSLEDSIKDCMLLFFPRSPTLIESKFGKGLIGELQTIE
ncbi:hypothetical protein CDAR_289471 [Caerostris darwini]|uniref:Uncharacterized protein n=1 Tax=Caerostris darwini TaxID=1538125 RepID=A0AAV4WC63_9ARAC|nr:hypothetical protein CDAR_289471 [Caerostris darwini]